ncbi:MAG: hypothetical protein ACM3JH_11720 [Acidithiobacillales bacterium]
MAETARAVPGSLLKLSETEQDEDRELEFELAFLRSLSTAQRFELMFDRSRQMAESLRAHGHGEAASILKRP